MAKHKAATEILIVTEERTPLAQLVDRYKFHFFAGFVVLAAVILFQQSRGHAAVVEDRAQWDGLYSALGGTAETAFPSSVQALDADALQRAATSLGAKPAADWARLLAALGHAEKGSFDDATEVALQLKNSGDKLLTGFTLPIGKDGKEVSLAEHLNEAIKATEGFRSQNGHLFANEEPPADAPVAVIETALGKIEVALYPNLAPKHVENFIKLATEGFYDGTKFHRVIKDFMIQGGDPNTKEGAPETWGQGGPGYKVEREVNSLVHFPLVLAAAKTGQDIESSGSQFYIMTGSKHDLDGKHVVYGKVIGGESVVRAIESGAPDPTSNERPLDPVTVTSIRMR
jgi:cyclophilin family peptidyl-prolyl cis-trans isomerase